MCWGIKWSKTGCCVRNICEWIQPEQPNGMRGLIVEWNEGATYGAGAEVGEIN